MITQPWSRYWRLRGSLAIEAEKADAEEARRLATEQALAGGAGIECGCCFDETLLVSSLCPWSSLNSISGGKCSLTYLITTGGNDTVQRGTSFLPPMRQDSCGNQIGRTICCEWLSYCLIGSFAPWLLAQTRHLPIVNNVKLIRCQFRSRFCAWTNPVVPCRSQSRNFTACFLQNLYNSIIVSSKLKI